ncbi:hypothetical protein SAMN05660297_03171 [Natronincola peptidivorans]|uniref:Uncharacterized protein n=1 Tax=Natronincola peptidivorans TaxID=426128 RepID=A0A1I0GEI0_9FIRM|nr:hypothetical protein [Natronincola peptidivorans]SET69266.1 hypothetical protein SAMN05660297_03171 [Natronincola peptidivorans]
MSVKNENNETRKKNRKCGVYTCIHCVLGACVIEQCEMYENRIMQEE